MMTQAGFLSIPVPVLSPNPGQAVKQLGRGVIAPARIGGGLRYLWLAKLSSPCCHLW